MNLVFMNIELLVDAIHAPGVEEYQRDENVDRTLLGKPETQLKAADADMIKLLDQQNAEAVGTDEPDEKAGCNEP
jgi:hypothetical protein